MNNLAFFILVGISLAWLGFMYGGFSRGLWTSIVYRPGRNRDERVLLLLNALKHFAVFAIVFALLYTLQIFFGDAEPWLSK